MKRKLSSFPVVALLGSLLVVYVLFTVCRLAFLVVNWQLYADTLTWSHALQLFAAGLIFDTSAILYTNALVILLMLLPLHWKERRGYYRVVGWLYVVCNTVALWANLMDCVYFAFTGKRTTTTVFHEFSHEGAGGFARIMGEQFAAHWALVLTGFAMSGVLWLAFRLLTRNLRAQRPSAGYYAVQTLSLLAAIPLSVGGMRGGFTTAVRPITISNANQYADQAPETGIVLNTPFAIYRTLSKRPMTVPRYMSQAEAARLYSPLHAPGDTAAFRKMNVVVIILESFSKQHFGFYNRTLRGGAYSGFTPFLDSLIAHGAATWRYSYANGRKSIEGMPSVLSSLPNYVEPLFLTPASLNHLGGLARELGGHEGYQTAFFHGAQNGSMGFQAFARATGFQQYYGRTEYDAHPQFNGDADFDGTWAIWDEEFLQYYATVMGTMRQPFMTAVFTASSHSPFKVPERYKGVFPKGDDVLQECVAYSDHALRRFFATASRQPWFANTVFAITADHTSAPVDPFYFTTLGHYEVPVILYAPADSALHFYDEERVVEQTDIMPTVLSYLHYGHPYIAFGKDMLSGSADRSFALHWLPESESYEYVTPRYLLQFDGRHVTAAYRYREDSLLRRNIVESMPPDTLLHLTRHMESVIQQYMERMEGDSVCIAENEKTTRRKK